MTRFHQSAHQEGRPLVAVAGVSKRFGGTVALADVDLTIRAGEVHALVGENGAGKSTLGKVVAGVNRADQGLIRLRGETVDFKSPKDSVAAGVAFIAQELALVPDRSVLENVFLGRRAPAFSLVRRGPLLSEYQTLLDKTGFDINPARRAGSLRLAEQQQVEILRALARDADLIIMDEPTAALGGADSERLLRIVADLRAEGRTVVFVTHFLAEALAVADRVTVLKDGRVVRTAVAEDETPESLVESMLGRSLGSMFPEASEPAGSDVVLSVEGLTRHPEFRDVDLHVRRGEIVGIAGLVGAGRTELVETIVGVRRPDSGTVRVAGTTGPFRSPQQARRAGVVLVPESRKDHGLFMGRSVRENVTLPHLPEVSRLSFVSKARQTAHLAELLPTVGIDVRRVDSRVEELSGGNQQKVMFARWLFHQPTVFIADEPTRGVDVGARASLYQLLRQIADDGSAVLFVSSDNEEIVGLADRVLVMRSGRLVGQLVGGDVTEDNVLQLMFADDLAEETA